MKVTFARVFVVVSSLMVLAIVVGFTALASQQAAAAAERVERLTPLTSAVLDDRQVGREVLVEGRISPRNPALLRDFVAYVEEEYRRTGNRRRREWVEDEQRVPPLVLDVADGAIALDNHPYEIESPPHLWQETDERGANTGRRYRGFRVGDVVLVVGTLVSEGEEVVLQAHWIRGGTRADYLANRRNAAALLPQCVLLIALIGVGLAVGWYIRRRKKEAPRPGPS